MGGPSTPEYQTVSCPSDPHNCPLGAHLSSAPAVHAVRSRCRVRRLIDAHAIKAVKCHGSFSRPLPEGQLISAESVRRLMIMKGQQVARCLRQKPPKAKAQAKGCQPKDLEPLPRARGPRETPSDPTRFPHEAINGKQVARPRRHIAVVLFCGRDEFAVLYIIEPPSPLPKKA